MQDSHRGSSYPTPGNELYKILLLFDWREDSPNNKISYNEFKSFLKVYFYYSFLLQKTIIIRFWGRPLIFRLLSVLYYCIVFIHFYSASHNMSLSEALPTTAIDTVSEFTSWSAIGNCKWRTCPRSLRGG